MLSTVPIPRSFHLYSGQTTTSSRSDMRSVEVSARIIVITAKSKVCKPFAPSKKKEKLSRRTNTKNYIECKLKIPCVIKVRIKFIAFET